MRHVLPRDLYRWRSIKAEDLRANPARRVPLRLVADSREMGELMAREFADLVELNNSLGVPARAIIPCGPTCWYGPWIP